MTDYDDGKIHGWNGGDCPVHPKSIVEIWFHRGGGDTLGAENWHWAHDLGDSNIIAFRVVKQHVEPKTIWVNERGGIIFGAYTSEEAARRSVDPHTTRIAVKYQEVTEND